MDDARQAVGREQRDGGVPAGRRARQMGGEFRGAALRGREPQRPAGEAVPAPQQLGELAQTGMEDKPRIPLVDVPHDRGVLFLVPDQVAHRGQAARDGMRPVRDAAPERQVVKDGHVPVHDTDFARPRQSQG